MAQRKKTDAGEQFEKYLPFILEIRKRLTFVVIFFIIAAAIGFIYNEKIITFLLHYFAFDGVNVVFTSPFQFLGLALNTGMIIGFIVVFPLFVYELLAFLKPALAPHEFKALLFLIPLSLILFVLGFLFGAMIMRYVIVLFYQKTINLDIGNFLDITKLLSQILTTALLMGIAFQFPIVITLLIRLGVIPYKFFKQKRVFAWAIALVFAAVLPPTDLFSLVLLTLPLIALYEVTLFANRYIFRGKIAL